jgi:REP element-mobilizing transposase RayT
MSQSLARLNVHLIFSTKHRERFLDEAIRPELHDYMGAVLSGLACRLCSINSVEDHVHLLFELARTAPLSKVVKDVKKSSSKWIKTKGPRFSTFAWQAGYGAFAVSESNIDSVRRYIARQEEHHRRKGFQEEYLAFLKRHNVAFDERYLWD